MKVAGFKAAAVAAGLRYKGRPDLGLIMAEEPVTAAGVFTQNIVQAAPVLWSKEKAASGRAIAILVNSGQANACTGDAGLAAVAESALAVAQAIKAHPDQILVASTGVIGQPINLTALKDAVPSLVAHLSEDGLEQVAAAMMTTDTKRKISRASTQIGDRTITVVGMAKGSGMIAPNMATMLAFVLTDAAAASQYLLDVLRQSAEMTFNRVTVDGDTSTNDCVLAMASAKAGNPLITSEADPGAADFAKAFQQVMADLAKMIAADGEGATKLVRILVQGAKDETQAKAAAMTVANSPLVKTALFGQDANWGRIMAALGRSGAQFDPYQVDILIDEALLVSKGQAAGDEKAAAEIMRKPEFSVNIHLHAGPAGAEALTCDFSYDYVKINADYRS